MHTHRQAQACRSRRVHTEDIVDTSRSILIRDTILAIPHAAQRIAVPIFRSAKQYAKN